MRIARIAPLVEGDGEVTGLPVLLRRIIHSIDPMIHPAVCRCFRHPSGNLRRAGGLERPFKRLPKCTLLTLFSSSSTAMMTVQKTLPSN